MVASASLQRFSVRRRHGHASYLKRESHASRGPDHEHWAPGNDAAGHGTGELRAPALHYGGLAMRRPELCGLHADKLCETGHATGSNETVLC